MNRSGEKRLRSLAIAHVAIGLGAGVVAPIEVDAPLGLIHILIVPLVASAACQSVLLAVWGVTSRHCRGNDWPAWFAGQSTWSRWWPTA